MTQAQARVKKLARLLELAAKKHNESADATCSVAACFDRSDGDLSEEVFDRVFDAVTELSDVSAQKTPDYRRAARELIARLTRKAQKPVSVVRQRHQAGAQP
jgi:hypothetical protein